MTESSFRPFALTGLLAAAAVFMSGGNVSATPVANGFATSGFVDIARAASAVTEVGRRARRVTRQWEASRDWYRRRDARRGRYYGFGAPLYYGGLHPYYRYTPGYSYYPSYSYYLDAYEDYEHQAPVRQTNRGSKSCRAAHRACVRNWGYGGGNYTGCMKYERCRPR